MSSNRRFPPITRVFFAIFMFGLCIGYAAAVHAQTTLEPAWLTRFGGTGIIATPVSIVSDQQDNSFVVANVLFTSAPAHQEVVTIKYDNGGNILWKAWIGSASHPAQAADIALDSSANVYILAATGNPSTTSALTDAEFVTAKYNSAGVRQWITYVPPSSGGNNFPFKLALASPDSVYVTGTSAASGNSTSQALTIKYDASGALLWSRRTPASAIGGNSPAGFGIDGSQNVFIAVNSTHFAPTIYKLDSAGNSTGSFSPPNFPSFTAFTVDSAGSVFAAGCYAPGPTAAKFDGNGTLLWTHSFAPTRCFTDMLGDGQGGIFLAETLSPQSNSSSVAMLVRLDTNGVQQWENRSPNRPSSSNNLGFLDNNNVIELGEIGNPSDTGFSASPTLLQYTPAGQSVFTPEFPPQSQGSVFAVRMAIGANNVVFVTASAVGQSSGTFDLLTAAFAPAP
jgi:hypothetical protein